MAKRLTEKQKEEIKISFTNGKSVEILAEEFFCSKLTIIRNLKKNLGELKYQNLVSKFKAPLKFISSKDNEIINENLNNEKSNKRQHNKEFKTEILNELDFDQDEPFFEITPLDYEIEDTTRKEFSSVPLSEVTFPKIVYIIVDKKIELEIKLLKDYPEWEFLPIDDMNRKTIEIYFDLKVAKRFCNKEQKVIKVPNTEVFRMAAPFLISRGISRIVSSEQLIAL